MYTTYKNNADTFTPAKFESDGKIVLNGEEITYHTVSEDNVFYEEGKPIASIFSYSYFRTGVNSENRPVIFAYNGGPGTSSMYVHAGFLGAHRVKYDDEHLDIESLPPYEVIDNPDCLLDVADLVLVDPVATGYGLLIDESKEKEFWGIEEDAEALLTFIEQWTHRYNRECSPKYLCGESYGCTRSATAAGIACTGGKERTFGVKFDGLILIGNTVTIGKYFNREVMVENSVLWFPTFAAIHWYHNHPSNQSVEDFVKEAKAFADTEYLLALYKGESLQGEEREEMLRKLNYYTGMSKEYLETNALQINEDTFRQNVIKDKGQAVSRCDGRLTRPLIRPQSVEDKKGAWDDALMDRYDGYYYGALTGKILPMLNVKLDRPYVPAKYKDESAWNVETKGGTTAERLRDAMNTTFGMRTFFVNGWYDDCTQIGFVYYTMDHAGLPKDRIYVKGYKSGHMAYLGEDNVKELSADIRKFVTNQDPTK